MAATEESRQEGGRSADLWAAGDLYEQYVGRWSRQVAPEFLTWLGVPPARVARRRVRHRRPERHDPRPLAPASVPGVDPSEGFLASGRGAARGPAPNGRRAGAAGRRRRRDAVVAGLVLNFVPDRRGPPRDARVPPGGRHGRRLRLGLRRHGTDALLLGRRGRARPGGAEQDEGRRFPLCRPDPLRALFRRGPGVQSTAIDMPTVFRDFDDYWTPFLGGQGPAPAYACR